MGFWLNFAFPVALKTVPFWDFFFWPLFFILFRNSEEEESWTRRKKQEEERTEEEQTHTHLEIINTTSSSSSTTNTSYRRRKKKKKHTNQTRTRTHTSGKSNPPPLPTHTQTYTDLEVKSMKHTHTHRVVVAAVVATEWCSGDSGGRNHSLFPLPSLLSFPSLFLPPSPPVSASDIKEEKKKIQNDVVLDSGHSSRGEFELPRIIPLKKCNSPFVYFAKLIFLVVNTII